EESFTFELALCMVSDQDVLVHGPGSNDQTSEVAYLSIDFSSELEVMAGELRIDLGVDEQFDSSDDILVGVIGPGYDFVLMPEPDGFTLRTELREGSSGRSTGPTEAVIECS